MAIALDTSTDLSNTTGTSLSSSHTVTGSNILAFVIAMMASDAATGITFGGTSMTQIKKVALSGGNELYVYGINPAATGSNAIVISAGSSVLIKGMAISYTGAQQSLTMDSTPVSSAPTGVGDGSWTGVANTVVGANCWQLNAAIKSASGIPAASNNCTTRKNAAAICVCDSNGTVSAGARTQSVNCVGDGTQNWAHIAFSFGPFVAASGHQKNINTLGAG